MSERTRKKNVRRMCPIYTWWAVILLIMLCCFSFVFIGVSCYQQVEHLHEEFIARGIDKSKYLGREFNIRVLEYQKNIGFLSQDMVLLNALTFGEEQELLAWVRTLERDGTDPSYFVYSANSKKIYSSDQRISGFNEVVLKSLTPSFFSIYRSSKNGYFFSISKLLRSDGRFVGNLGCAVSFKKFLNNVGLDHTHFAVVIKDNGFFYDVNTGRKISRKVTLLRDSLHGFQSEVLFNEASIAIPFGVSGLYLHASTDNLDTKIWHTVGIWFLVTIPICVFLFFFSIHLMQRGTVGLVALTKLTGNTKKDMRTLLAARESATISELHDAVENMLGLYEKLVRSEELKRYTATFDATSMGLVLCDSSGHILEWNSELMELLGETKRSWYGVSVKELFRKVDQLAIITGMAHVRQFSAQGVDQHGAFKARLRLNSTRKGAQHVDVIIKKIEFDDRESLLFMLYNVTDQVTAERQMQQAKRSAEQVAHDKHHFYMGLTAEIEPLAEALNQSIIFLGETVSTSSQQRHLERITVHNDLLFELITNIRDFALLETGSMVFERTSFQLEALLKQAHAATYARAMQMKSDICFYLDPTTPQELWFDFSKSLQVLTSLINLAARQVYGGLIVLIVTSSEERDGFVQLRFEICAQPKGYVNSSDQFDNTLPEPTYNGQKGQQLCLAIVQRIIKMFSILDFKQWQNNSGALFYAVDAKVSARIPKRNGLHRLLEGKNIGLIYCPHNTPGFIARMMSALGAQCEFLPVGKGFCKDVIVRQDEFDVFFCCDCIFSAVPKEEYENYCGMLTRPIYSVAHSYWESTSQNANVVTLRKPFLANEMLSLLCDRLLATVNDYTAIEDTYDDNVVLLVFPKNGSETKVRHELEQGGYVPVIVNEVTKGVNALALYRPSVIIIDTDNITINGYWLIKELREFEEAERMVPAKIIMIVGQEYQVSQQQIDLHTLVIGKPVNASELVQCVLTLSGQTEKIA